MTNIFEFGFEASVAAARDKIDRNFSYAERMASTALCSISTAGRSTVADDLRLQTADLTTRPQAIVMMAHPFEVYGKHVELSVGAALCG